MISCWRFFAVNLYINKGPVFELALPLAVSKASHRKLTDKRDQKRFVSHE